VIFYINANNGPSTHYLILDILISLRGYSLDTSIPVKDIN